MSFAKKTVTHESQNQIQRSLYDRRAGNDRRSKVTALGYTSTEKRQCPERRLSFKEKRVDWVRDTKWSSINLDLLR